MARRRAKRVQPGRRRFLIGAGILAAIVGLAETIWLALSFIRPRPARTASGGSDNDVVVAGPEEVFKAGSVTAFPEGKFYLVHLTDGGFLAIHRRCTHLGCTVPWDAETGTFACPCHASTFDMRGVVLSPPAPRPLDHFPVRIENGIVKVDVSRPLRRRAFDPSQVRRL